MSDQADKLLPCPLCNGKNLRQENLIIEAVIGCYDCGLYLTRRHSTKDDDGVEWAIKDWNTRPAQAPAEQGAELLAEAVNTLRPFVNQLSDISGKPTMFAEWVKDFLTRAASEASSLSAEQQNMADVPSDIEQAYKEACKLAKQENVDVKFHYEGMDYTVLAPADRDAVIDAYGLLWGFQGNQETDKNARLAFKARHKLRDILTDEERKQGIQKAGTYDDARF